jgi:hypothetical protein
MRETDHEAEKTARQLKKVNTALSPKRGPIGFDRQALRIRRRYARARNMRSSFRNRRSHRLEDEQGRCQRCCSILAQRDGTPPREGREAINLINAG